MPDLRILILVDNWDGDTSDHYLSDLSYVKYCKKLMYLEFFVGDVTDLSVLADLNEMVDLNISYNPVSDITPLLNYPKLERLFLEHTNVSEADYELLKKHILMHRLYFTEKALLTRAGEHIRDITQ